MGGNGSGRPRTEIDQEELFDLYTDGVPMGQLAAHFGISKPTLSKKIAELSEIQGEILKYRELQGVQITALIARVLDHITPEKIEAAEFKDLVNALKILKNFELVHEGKPDQIKGIVHYVTELEKREVESQRAAIEWNAFEAEYSVIEGEEEDEEEYT